MPYERVIISKVLGSTNELGMPKTYLGIMKKVDDFPEWTDNRREIILAFGKTDPDGPYYIGEVRKKDSKWVFIWAIPVCDIVGYSDLIDDSKKSKKVK